MIGNSPVLLCELKRYDAIDTPAKFDAAVKQLQDYARSEDFDEFPPFLLLYCGKPERTRFYARRIVADATLQDSLEYEELSEPWTWDRVRSAHLKGSFAQEVVGPKRLREILLDHLDRIEDDLRSQVRSAVELVSTAERPPILSDYQKWLDEHPEAERQMAALYERKAAEIPKATAAAVTDEMVTQGALNYLNKVFFLNLCEDRNLPGFYRIMREFLPETKSETTSTAASVFLGLLRRKILNTARVWDPGEERAYRDLRSELTSEIRDHVIEQNNWWELIRVAFDLAEEQLPLVYRENAYDHFHPGKDSLAELIFDLSTKSFRELTNRHVGDIYQALLASRRRGSDDRGGRRHQRSTLGAFYTPQGDVEYMVSKLGLAKDSRVLDPCMGSGHFLAGIYDELARLYADDGHDLRESFRQIVGSQLYGGDIDTFATSLAAIRVFLLDETSTRTTPQLFVHDMLLHSPARTIEMIPAEERAAALEPDLDEIEEGLDRMEFDAIVGNPPYGARKPAYKKKSYARIYGARKADLKAGSLGTGDADTYAMFFANGIERLKEGGRMCLITNDSFRSLTTHAALRRHILDTCKIAEILLTDTKHFEGVSFQFAGMAITTLEKCSDAEARAANEMRLVDYVRDPSDYSEPPPAKVSTLRQDEYEALPETPFFVGVPRDVFDAAKASGTVGEVAKGRVGLQTGDDKRFLAGIGEPFPGLPTTVAISDVAEFVDDEEKVKGLAMSRARWVPFAKGEGLGEYWRPPQVAIDWSRHSVEELETRAGWPSGTARKTYFRNRDHYFTPGLTYSVISSGRISVRLMQKGWIFGHKGSAVFPEDDATSELFLLGYLNSALATYFMKRIVNTTATADIGYIEKLPYRRPSSEIEQAIVERVERIIDALKADPSADISPERSEIDELIFDLFEIRDSRAEVLRFYENVGKAEKTGAEIEGIEAQAARV